MTETLPDSLRELPEFPSPRAAGCPFGQPPRQLAAAAAAPLTRVRIWDGSEHWFITGHAEQRTVLADPRISANEKLPGFPHQNAAGAEGAKHHPVTIFNSDDPEHSRIRRMMTFPFTFKKVEALRPKIQRITDELIDRMLAGPKPADLVTELALPLPTQMICDLLGVPIQDQELFQRAATVAVDRNASPETNASTSQELVAYLAELIERRRTEPGEGWVADLAERVNAGDTTVAEAAMMGIVLLIAGHETSANMIALGTTALFANPDQLALLRAAEDSKAVAAATEELLRFLSIAQHGLRRVALEDVEVGGEVIRAGEGLIMPLPIANWDPTAFPEPEELDLGREGARQHVAFGFGIHQCVGQQLARVELQVVYGTLYRRIPTLALATDLEKLKFKEDAFAYGVYSLPVTW